jgi:HAMP domain-containing protein
MIGARAPLSVGTRFRRFFALPAERKRAFLTAIAMLVGVRIALWAATVEQVESSARRFARRTPDTRPPTPGSADRVSWAVGSAARFVPGASCLAQAIAAEALLIRAGHPAEIRLGVAKDGRGRIEAHAWVEVSGRVILGDGDLKRYVPLEPRTEIG